MLQLKSKTFVTSDPPPPPPIVPENTDEILLIEPFYGGSHKELIDLLHRHVKKSTKVVMTAKKWHWRSRVSALHFSVEIPRSSNFK